MDAARDDVLLRALNVLESLAAMAQPASLSAIAARTRLGKAKAYRALRALEEHGFVDHAGRSGYRVGSRSLALATVIGSRPALVQRTRPVLERLALLCRGGASLQLRSGAHRVIVAEVVVRADPQIDPVALGERAPLTSGCAGTAILAHLDPADAAAVMAARPPREPRPTPEQLDRIRADGYAVSFSANHVSMNGIAAPLLDPADGSVLGSIAMANAPDRLPARELEALSDPLRRACDQLGPSLARLLGPNSPERRAALDVTVQQIAGGT